MRQLAKLGLTLLLAFILALGFLVLAPALLAQNVNSRYDNILWTSSYVAGQTVLVPVPGATVQVCTYPANAVPCTNLATLFAGPTTLGGTILNPISSDSQGNFGFWAAAGYYQYTLTNSLGQSAGPYSITLGGSGGSGAVYALFPSTQGVVFNTSTTNSITATSAQLVAAANTSPSVQFSPALIPPVGSSVIPATTNVLKGSGSAGSAVAAVPGTDYLIPGALPNGTAATTQSASDTSTKLATDAFVPASIALGVTTVATRSGTSSNTDLVGILTLSGGTQTYTFAGTYTTAPVCVSQDRTTPTNTSQASATTTVLTITGTGTDAVGYICAGLN